MNKRELIEQISLNTGISVVVVKRVFASYIEIATTSLQQKEDIVLANFGRLAVLDQSQRLARNPKTGVPVMIQPRVTARFKPGKGLLEALNKKTDDK